MALDASEVLGSTARSPRRSGRGCSRNGEKWLLEAPRPNRKAAKEIVDTLAR
jgi:hypothetical protein